MLTNQLSTQHLNIENGIFISNYVNPFIVISLDMMPISSSDITFNFPPEDR